MNKQKLLSSIKQSFMVKRYKAQEECEEFIEKLRENFEFNQIYTDLTKKQLELARAELIEDSLKLKHDIADLKMKINNYLALNNIDANKLTPNYDCKICNDTGVAGGRICKCLTQELNLQLSLRASSQTQFRSFDDCNKDIMDETDIKTCEKLKTWCARYPNITTTNINIIGGAGSGKTFMLECVANELIKKGVVVCFKTAFEINELARLYHIGKSYDFSDCLNSEVLIIDDLGTEPVLKNVTKEYLYNLINIRQINNRPTLISTNLSLNNILDRYDERIFSRLANKNLSTIIQLVSEDKRLK
ncbi:MAG: ATP-binding protein [Clostridia bacterium]|nr:ATP-binding protein [Clostridia bacterium]